MSVLNTERIAQDHSGLQEVRQLAQRIVEILADGKAQDTILMDVSAITVIADFFVITTGSTDRQVRALANRVVEELETHGIEPQRMEGLTDARWVVLDFGDIFVHIFTPADRRFYNLEDLWSRGVTIARVL